MAKMLRTATGSLVDWDLMRINADKGNNVAQKVEITLNPQSKADRRAQRAKMDAARKLLEEAQRAKRRDEEIKTLPPVESEQVVATESGISEDVGSAVSEEFSITEAKPMKKK
jgi:hypothetical protein